MKKTMKISVAAVLALAIVVAFAAIAVAGSVYDRDTCTVSTTGAGTWTNTTDYASISLKRIWFENAGGTNQSVAVTRVTSDGAYTQTVGTVTIGANTSGSTATFTAAYAKKNDKLVFASTGGLASSGGVAVVEYEVQKH